MLVTATLPADCGLRVDGVAAADDHILVVVTATNDLACCPVCGRPSQRVHSHDTRRAADLPWQGLAVRLELRVRRFRCPAPDCPRQIFAERLPGVVAAGARRSERLTTLVLAISLALGGEAGARLTGEMGVAISADTLRRGAKRLPPPAHPTPRVLGVDDWSWRKGRRWGTILVDPERHRTVDLLAERTAAALAEWLRRHPGVQVIARDRGAAYADGARPGAPDAVQVADRFHIVKNLAGALERLLQRQHAPLAAAAAAVDRQVAAAVAAPTESAADPPAPADPAPERPPRDHAARQAKRARRVARYEAARALHARGVGIRAIARQLHMGRRTVRLFVHAEAFPERASATHRRPRRRFSRLTQYEPYLRARWAAGCRNAQQLWEELRAREYAGSASMVRHFVAGWRTEPSRRGTAVPRTPAHELAVAPPAPTRVPSPRQAVWLLLRWAEEVTEEQRAYLGALRESCADVAAAADLAQAFRRRVRDRDEAALGPWMERARASGLAALGSFVAGLDGDRAAVEAALRLPYSNGQTEAQVLQVKAVRRQVRGRGGFELLRRRVVKSA